MSNNNSEQKIAAATVIVDTSEIDYALEKVGELEEAIERVSSLLEELTAKDFEVNVSLVTHDEALSRILDK